MVQTRRRPAFGRAAVRASGAPGRLRQPGKQEGRHAAQGGQVRLQPEERKALAVLYGEGRTASDVIRLLFREQADLPLSVEPAEADALHSTNEKFRRVGINLNQAVLVMNEGRVGYEPHLDAALRFLVDGIFRLRADVDLMLRIGRMERGRAGRGA